MMKANLAVMLGFLPQVVAFSDAVSEALAAEVAAEDIACVDDGDDSCEAGLSLRQLRGEVRSVDALAAQGRAGEEEKCAAAQHWCADLLTYGGKDACEQKTSVCQLLGGTEEAPALCVPVHEECDTEPDDEDDADAEAEEKDADLEADLGADYFTGIPDFLAPGMEPAAMTMAWGTCLGRICSVYLPGATCQCNPECKDHGSCCPDIADHCAPAETTTPTLPPDMNDGLFHGNTHLHGHVMTLYHTTSKEIAEIIVKEGFKPGHTGWCGGGIYFINTPYLPKTKYAPGITQSGAILEAKVQMGRMARMLHRCKGLGGGGVKGAKKYGYNSLTFSQHDGQEWIIWDTQQVLSVKIYKYM